MEHREIFQLCMGVPQETRQASAGPEPHTAAAQSARQENEVRKN